MCLCVSSVRACNIHDVNRLQCPKSEMCTFSKWIYRFGALFDTNHYRVVHPFGEFINQAYGCCQLYRKLRGRSNILTTSLTLNLDTSHHCGISTFNSGANPPAISVRRLMTPTIGTVGTTSTKIGGIPKFDRGYVVQYFKKVGLYGSLFFLQRQKVCE